MINSTFPLSANCSVASSPSRNDVELRASVHFRNDLVGRSNSKTTGPHPPFREASAHLANDAFTPLTLTLNALQDQGERFRIWWRDDDAQIVTGNLRRILNIRRGVPIALAVIPAGLSQELIELVASTEAIVILQHGWNHFNWCKDGERPSEFPDTRSRHDIICHLAYGFEILKTNFPFTFRPVFVPPWHSCPVWIVDALADLGFSAISRDAPLFPIEQLTSALELNVEIDTSDWASNGRFIGIGELTRRLLRAFQMRVRCGAQSTPIGLLTHHAALSCSDFDQLEKFVQLFDASDAVEWISIDELLPTKD